MTICQDVDLPEGSAQITSLAQIHEAGSNTADLVAGTQSA